MLDYHPPRNLKQLFDFLYDRPEVIITGPNNEPFTAYYAGIADGQLWFRWDGGPSFSLPVKPTATPNGFTEPGYIFEKKKFIVEHNNITVQVRYSR